MEIFRNDELVNKIYSLFYIIVIIFIIRLIDIQIIKYSYFYELSEKNRTRVIPRNGPRGNIITSDGIVVARNKISYSIMYFPSDTTNYDYLKKLSYLLSKIVGLNSEKLLTVILQAQNTHKPIKLVDRIGLEIIKSVYEIKNIFPELEIIEENIRDYPFNNYLSHVIGYVGKIEEKDIRKYILKGYSLDSIVGKNGVELMYEDELRGKNGGLFIEVDNRGRLVKVLGYEPWSKGNDVYLTVNWNVQKAAEDALRKLPYKRGAAVACEADSGRIIAYAVKPGIDLNNFVLKSSDTSYSYNVDEFNIPIQGLYPPASTFKIITTIAALESQKISKDRKFFCPGFYDAGSRVFKCWEKRGHGWVSMIDGLAKSCDVYYYNVADIVGPYEIENIAKRFRLDQKTGIDMPYEKTPIIFGPKKRIETKGYWYRGDTLNMSIGQGEIVVTPISMLLVIMAIANGGKFYKPYYVEKIVDERGNVLKENYPIVTGSLTLKPHTWDVLYKALREVVINGTGKACDVNGIEVYGKTGTAQNPHGKDHAWFVAFAKKDGKKTIAVSVIIEHGEHGSSAAAPVASKLIQAYYNVRENNSIKMEIIE
ncbi:MAG: penicillin-binding protein 2 [Elusimicrobiales bacterium]|nr:penicillin-binding protein 2 [Elusimicrobiales bacterium]